MNRLMIRLLAAVLMGIILGSSGMNLYISRQFEELTAKNRTLEEELKTARNDVEELRKRLEKQEQRKEITDIKPNVRLEAEEKDNLPSFEAISVKLNGQKKIKQLLLPLKGQEIKNVDYSLIPRVIDGREFESEGRRYVLKVDIIIITNELHVYATAKLLKQNK
ncbi:putative RNase H-like nuclease (RuvC/YqgF family) [Desulfohalotomaculum tongense]|uniref:hypothetical protein n=1 Tax=Desulforadius tongensis TaxID=1216062 RepID=UPI00195E3754|nr:hypothetical protein [Desulforadius tongensis]MBM7854073.1 putative RNase H-like nuclease (RuvC/YqgF family) [Desulforadius tongensis]